MISWLEMLTLVLATWRLSHMLAKEQGPGDIFDKLRLWLGAKETMNFGWTGDTFWSKLVVCPLCLSVWIAAIMYLCLPWLWWGILILAISGAASLLQLVAERD